MASRVIARAAVVGSVFVSSVLAVSTTGVERAQAAESGIVSGHVFNDEDMDGTDDTEPRVEGIGVKVFDSTGALVGSDTTDASGEYSISVSSAATTDVRVEFTTVRPWVASFVGPDSGGDVQFVSLPASNVNFAVQIPGEWCVNNGGDPDLAVTRLSPNAYRQGIDGGFGSCNNGSVITMPWYTNQPLSWDPEARYGGTTSLVRHRDTGATYGLAYDAASSTIWTSAFIRRHSGLGPKGIGGLYVTSSVGGVVESFDLAAAPWNLTLKDPGTDYSDEARGLDNTSEPPEYTPSFHHSQDAVAFAGTGKDGIGDLAIDARNSKLWLVNLYTKSVQRIGITGTSSEPSLASTVDTYPLPQVGAPSALCSITGSVARPFGLYLNPRNQHPWVGVVCTNEAAAIPMSDTNQDSAPAERAMIVELDPAGNSGAGAWSVVAEVNLDYPHRNENCGYSTFPLPQPAVDSYYWRCWDVQWHAWTDDFTGLYDRMRASGRVDPSYDIINMYYAQPIVSGIAELGDGSIVVGLTDRLNIQMAEDNLVPIEPDAVYNATYESNRLDGDVLLLCRTGSTYVQESQGSCTSTGDPYSRTYQAPLRPWAGAAANLEGAEFFADNIYDFDPTGLGTHTEMSNGAVAVWPQSGDPAAQQVAYTSMDPLLNIFEGGIRWASADTGDAVSGKTLAAGDPPASFKKSANLGNLEVFCDSAPIQLVSRAWYDANKDGIQDPGEPPIAGATAHLYDSSGTLVGTAITDADGNYSFSSNVTEDPAGNGDSSGGGLEPLRGYTILFDNADDYASGGALRGLMSTTAGSTASGGANSTAVDSNLSQLDSRDPEVSAQFPGHAVPALLPGHNEQDIDAGLTDAVALTGTVWTDSNGNGVRDWFERPVEGVLVELLDANGDPLPGRSLTTDGNGAYSFDNLLPGTYKVRYTRPDGLYRFSDPGQGTDPLLDSDVVGAMPTDTLGITAPIVLSATVGGVMSRYEGSKLNARYVDDQVTAGIVPPKVGVGNVVWWDVNKNGVQDSDEPGIAGAVVSLSSEWETDADGRWLPSIVTDAQGRYFFDNLVPARYEAKVRLPWGWNNSYWTQQYAGDDPLLDSNAYEGLRPDWGGYENGRTEEFRISASPKGNTAYDPACSCMRDYDGTIAETDPSTEATLWNPTIDFGLHRMGLAVGDIVWADSNRNGLHDSGEPRVADVTVELLDGDGNPVNDLDGNPVASTTTDGVGQYVFTNLAPGTYRVRFTAPSGTQWTSPLEGADSRIDSNAIPTAADPNVAESRTFSLAWYGEAADQVINTNPTVAAQYINPTLDAGLIGAFPTPAAIVGVGDFVWLDLDADGLQDAGEPGIPGVTVHLLKPWTSVVPSDADGNPVQPVTTDENGHYFIDNLVPGDYWLRFALPWDSKNSQWTAVFSTFSEPLQDSNQIFEGFVWPFRVSDTAVGDTPYDTDCECSFDYDGTVAENDPSTVATLWNPTIDGGVLTGALGVGDRVWLDRNSNGIQDTGERGFANVTVDLVDSNGDPVLDLDGNTVASTTTDGSGKYAFGNLAPGTYKVRFTLPDGMAWTTALQGSDAGLDSDATPIPADPTIAESAEFTLSWDLASTREVVNTDPDVSAQYLDPTLDAGVVGTEPAVVGVGNFVWFDLDNDGVQDPGEPGIPGVTAQLYSCENNCIPKDADGNPVKPVTTDAYGHYFIDNLLPGKYWVRFTAPWGDANSRWSGRFQGNNPYTDSNVYTWGYCGGCGNLFFIGRTRDFKVSGTPVGTTPYNPSCFCARNYNGTIEETDPTTKATLWNPTIDGGISPRLAVGDTVWIDADEDGVQDTGEPGVRGLTVTLLDPSGAPAVDADGNAVAPLTTDSDGHYLFDNLAAGTYKVRFTLLDGMTWTTPLAEPDHAVDSDATPTGDPSVAESGEFTLSWDLAAADQVVNTDAGIAAQFINPTIDAGVVVPIVGVGDYVWLDINKDGIQDASEPVIPGVSVQLLSEDGTQIPYDADGDLVAPVTTDENGHYFIDNLLPGWYRVRFTLPWGVANSPWTQRFAGGDPLADSNVYTGVYPYGDWSGDLVYAGRTRRFHISSSAVGDTPFDPVCLCRWEYDATIVDTDPATKAVLWNPSIDGGIEPIGLAVGNFVWFDADQDGMQDAGEPGLSGVTVELLDSSGDPVNDLEGNPVGSQTTDSTGAYLFTNLVPGSYKVRFTLPAGMQWSKPLRGSDATADSDAAPTIADPLVAESATFTLAWDSMPTGQVINDDPSIPAQYINPSIDGGAIPLVGLGDTVWVDRDGDGVQDVGEPVLEGVTVELLDANGDPADDADGVAVGAAATDADGNYFFDNLLPGQYRVRFTLPAGYRFTTAAAGTDRTVDSNAVADEVNPSTGVTPTFTVAASVTGQTVADTDVLTEALLVDPSIDAGAVALVAIGDTVWVDEDQDGVQGLGEPGLDGVTVDLLDANGDPAEDADGVAVGSATTDANGNYLFDGLLSGDYRVRFTLPTGYRYTTAAAGTDRTVDSDAVVNPLDLTIGLTPVFTVHASETDQTVADTDALTDALLVDPTVDAGVVPLVAIGDTVWVDRNLNDLQDAGEPGLSGVTVELLDSSGNPANDADGAAVGSATTDANGNYFFDNLLPGDYQVRFTLPSGTEFVTAAVGGDRAVDSNAVEDVIDPLVGLTPVFTVHASETGETVEDTDALTGAVFVDPTIDAGAIVPIVAVGDRVWVDRDGDGVQDAGEPGLSGVTVELLNSLGNAAKDADGVAVGSATTDASGSYFIDNLLPGDYQVKFTLPAGYRYTAAAAGADRTVDSNALADLVNPLVGVTPTFTVAASATGQTVAEADALTDALFVNPSIDAGVLPLVAVGDTVWTDYDRDGVQDVGEAGISGVTVELLDSSGNAAKNAAGATVSSTTTDANGKYLFDNLLPGDYQVKFTLPAGYRYTAAAAGSDRTVDSNAVADLVDPLAGVTPTFTVAASATGQTVADSDVLTGALFVNPSIDAGAVPLVAVGDTVWVDRDGDGVQDVGEPGLSGVTVELLDSLGNPVTALSAPMRPGRVGLFGPAVGLVDTTDADGSYFFDNLLPGDYRVRFTLPNGYRYTDAAAGSDRTVDSNAVADLLDPLVGVSPTFTVAATATGQTVADADGLTAAVLVNPSIDAGAVPIVAVGDRVWVDRDGDGVQDVGEPALSGVTVELLDSLGDPAKDADGDAVASLTSDANGVYFFDNLLPGDYRVRFTLPNGYRYTGAAAGPDRTVDSNAVADLVDPLVGVTPTFTVAASATGETVAETDALTDARFVNPSIDAGILAPPVGLSSVVWIDSNGNGVRDGGEKPLAGVKVELVDADGNPVRNANGDVVPSQTTGGDGRYFFDNLLPGEYRLRFTLPSGWLFTAPGAGSDGTKDSNAEADPDLPYVGMTGLFRIASWAVGDTSSEGDPATDARLINLTIGAGVVRAPGLPETGSETAPIGQLGTLFAGMGLAAVLLSRRRRRPH